MVHFKKEIAVHTAFRVLFSFIFIMAGWQHIVGTAKVAARLGNSPFAPMLSNFLPLEMHVLFAGLVLFAGGLGLLFGSWTKQVALALLLVLIPITLTVQIGGEESLGPLFKNVALLGGLIYFSFFGTQGWHLESKFKDLKAKFTWGLMPIVFSLLIVFSVKVSTDDVSIMSSAHAASKTSELKSKSAKNLAILVREPKHIQIAILTAQRGFAGSDGVALSSARIIVCGKPGVEALKAGSAIEKKLQEASQSGIEIAACGLSLKEAGVTKEQLQKSVQVVDNGLWEMIKLQSQGSISIEL